MNYITPIELAMFEEVEPPQLERSNFSYSFLLLPKEQRYAINSLYYFCSYIDDIVDGKPNADQKILKQKHERLDLWVKVIEAIYQGKESSKLLSPLKLLVQRFAIPKQYFLTLIDGCRRDLIQKRYDTFEELKDYCYSVASVVGLITIEIFGHKYEETKNYAINLGYALQLTNIMRDVKFDKDRGYLYLPKEDLDRFGYSESDLQREKYNQNFYELMSFQADRAREYYHKARQLLRPDERAACLSAEVMDAIYYRLLEKIELKEFNVFEKKIRVATTHKLIITLKQWLSTKMFVSRLKKNK
ncbi:MAG: squalene/phytoene synthase family protein [Ignavibacteria bacterium]|nr:squalene/phytoene synthase family protein [Ignavibacteria bacterium]